MYLQSGFNGLKKIEFNSSDWLPEKPDDSNLPINTCPSIVPKKVLAGLVEKYHAGSDIILLAWIMQHPSKVIPVAGTVNVARIQQLTKASKLVLDKEDWFKIWTESMGNKVP
jgi:diketogulonate reductase-like aldo/keto reductase